MSTQTDKGKVIERWRRKVTGLKSEGSTIAGPPASLLEHLELPRTVSAQSTQRIVLRLGKPI